MKPASSFASGAPLNHSPNLYCKEYIEGAVKGFVTQLAASATGILTRKNVESTFNLFTHNYLSFLLIISQNRELV